MKKELLGRKQEKQQSKTRKQNTIIAMSIFLALSWGCNFPSTEKNNETATKTEVIDSNRTQELAEKYDHIASEAYEKQNQTIAIPNYIKALEYYEKLDNRKRIQIITKNIALGYYQQGNYSKYLEYIQKALDLAKEINYEYGIRFANASIGGYWYSIKNQPEISLQKYYLPGREALKILSNEEDKKELQAIYASAIGNCYMLMKNYKEAKKYRKHSIEINKNIVNNQSTNISINYYNMGITEELQKNYKKAEEYYTEGLKLSKENEIKYNMQLGYNYLANLYEILGDHKKAYEYRTQQYNLNQEINNETSARAQIELETNIKDKQLIQQKAEIIQQEEKEKRLEEEKKKTIRTAIASLIAALGAGGAALIARKGRRKERKNKEEIAHQKEIVEETNHQLEEKNTEVEAMNNQLESANKELEYKNKNITDSIHYAKRIQESFIQHPGELKKLFPESFMFFQPKDIVSGDFYRFKETPSGKKIIAAVDCTGHGVPGAFLTFIGNNILNDSVKAGKEKPGEILDYLSEGIKKQLKEKEKIEGDAIKDAMDIAIFSYDPKIGEFESAGAYNTIYIFKKGQMQKISGDKRPIGNADQIYTNKQLIIEPGSTVYLGTDGYADQFGGPKEKKMMKKKMTRLLEDIQKPQICKDSDERRFLTMEEQKARVKEYFDERKGDNEQTDDVLLIGIKV